MLYLASLETLLQLGQLATATVIFGLFLLVPGWLLGEATEWLGWRHLDSRQRTILAILLSLAPSPVLVYGAARGVGFALVWGLYGSIWFLFLLRIAQRRGRLGLGWFGNDGWLFAVWALVYSLGVVDLVFDREVWVNINAMDAIAHVGFTDAITRTGLPPANPFAYPGEPTPLFYYYFWYLMCSLVDQLGGNWVTARAAVQAGSLWLGAILALLVGLFAERVGPHLGMSMPPRRSMMWALVAVTGLDLLPWSFAHALRYFFQMGAGGGVSLEHWNEQATAWLGAVTMAPHHIAGLAMCMTAVLVWLETPRWIGVVIAGLAVGSAAGASLYTTLPTVIGLSLWGGWQLWRGSPEGRWLLVRLVGVGLVGLVFYGPFALELRNNSSQMRTPLALTIRAFEITDYWLPSIVKPLKQMPWAKYLLRLIFLPLNYLLEFGYFLLAAVLFWRWRRGQERPLVLPEQVLLALLAGSALLCTFVASTLSGNNDLGWRGFLIAQFVLLIWALPVTAQLVAGELRGWWRTALLASLVVGVLGTATELVNFRVRTDGSAVMRARHTREAYQFIAANSPRDAIMALNPDGQLDFFSALIGNRQMVSGGRAYGTYFGAGKPGEQALNDSLAFFSGGQSDEARADYLRRYRVGVIVVLPVDGIWKDRTSWVWQQLPEYENAGARVYLKGQGDWP